MITTIELIFLMLICFVMGMTFQKQSENTPQKSKEDTKDDDDSGSWYAGNCTCLSCLSTYMVVCPARFALEDITMECASCGKMCNFYFEGI